jgi:hypothetical protein
LYLFVRLLLHDIAHMNNLVFVVFLFHAVALIFFKIIT